MILRDYFDVEMNRCVDLNGDGVMIDCDVMTFHAWTPLYTRYQEWSHERGEEETSEEKE